MNIDTSDYYPAPLLPEDGSEFPDRTENPENFESPEISDKSDKSDGSDGSDRSNRSDRSDRSENKIITAIANVLSWVLVPVLMPVYGIILMFGLTILSFTGFGTRLAFTAIAFGFNVAIPAVVIIIMKRMGMIKDVGLNNREERFVPYLICIFCLIGTALFMGYKGAPKWMEMFFIGGAVAGIVEVVINRWWKISVHAAGIAGIVAMLLHIMIYDYTRPEALTWLLITIGCSGLLGASRIWLGRHSLGQVLAGYAVGFCAVYFVML